MKTENITIDHEGEEFTFRLHDPGIIHIYVKEIWWSVPDGASDIGPYIKAFEEYQTRLEALRANGWIIQTADSEHLYFKHDDADHDSSSEWKVTEQLE